MEPPRDADATEASRITISGHQMDVGGGLRTYATEQITGVASKYFGGVEDVAVTFSRIGKGGFGCSIRVHSGRELHFDGYGEQAEAHTAFNQALGRVAKQLRRRKRAVREDKPVNPTKQGLP